jgi:hypothetical protein
VLVILALGLVGYALLSWVIEGAVRRGVSRALRDNRDWLSGPRAPE